MFDATLWCDIFRACIPSLLLSKNVRRLVSLWGLFLVFTQGESLDELQENLREVVSMLLEDGEPRLEAEFVGTQMVAV